jgi:nitrate/nitrite-specific signal transduction histidine kinase
MGELSMAENQEKKDDVLGEEFLQVFKRGVQFTEELLRENERLRVRMVRLEEENRVIAQKTVDSGSYSELLDQMKELEEERLSLLQRFREVETESLDFKDRYREIEEENDRLANLYVASYQLHSTLDVKEVVRIAFEIIINLVGSMDFVLYIIDGEKLVPVRSQGRPLTSFPVVNFGEGPIGRAANDKALYASSEEMSKVSNEDPKVCVPLVVSDKLLGMFVMYSFLSQKSELTELDRELFTLLGGHAAVAMYSSRIFEESKNIVHDATSYMKLIDS